MADATDYGLAGGIGSFLQGYAQQKQQNTQNSMAQAGLLDKGYQLNQDTGQYEQTPDKQLENQAAALKAKDYIANQNPDPNHPDSIKKANFYKNTLNAFQPGWGDKMIQPGVMSAADLSGYGGGFLDKVVAAQASQIKGSQIANAMNGRVDVQKDNQTAKAVDDVTKDQQLNNSVQRIQGASRIQSQINDIKSGKIVDTKQFLGDLNMEYTNLLSGAQNTALGKQERTEYNTYASDLAGAIQKITGDPTSIHSPAVMNQLETSVGSLKQTYQNQVNTRATMLQRNYPHNPDATQAQKDKIKEMISNYGNQQQPQQGGGLLAGQGGQQAPQGVVEGTTARTKSGQNVVFKGGQWQPQ